MYSISSDLFCNFKSGVESVFREKTGCELEVTPSVEGKIVAELTRRSKVERQVEKALAFVCEGRTSISQESFVDPCMVNKLTIKGIDRLLAASKDPEKSLDQEGMDYLAEVVSHVYSSSFSTREGAMSPSPESPEGIPKATCPDSIFKEIEYTVDRALSIFDRLKEVRGSAHSAEGKRLVERALCNIFSCRYSERDSWQHLAAKVDAYLKGAGSVKESLEFLLCTREYLLRAEARPTDKLWEAYGMHTDRVNEQHTHFLFADRSLRPGSPLFLGLQAAEAKAHANASLPISI